jgi:hypothetical protein
MGYFRVHQGSGQVFDAIDLFLPDTQFETQVGTLSCSDFISGDSCNSNTTRYIQLICALWHVTIVWREYEHGSWCVSAVASRLMRRVVFVCGTNLQSPLQFHLCPCHIC